MKLLMNIVYSISMKSEREKKKRERRERGERERREGGKK